LVVTDNEKLGFDFGEGALETAPTSKEGSRRENCSMTSRWSSDEKYQNSANRRCIWNEYNLNFLMRNY